MKAPLLILLALCLVGRCSAQTVVYNKVSDSSYMRVVHNSEINYPDTFIINFYDNHTFDFQKKGVEDVGVQMIGDWKLKKNTLILTNRYPSEIPLKVNIVPIKDTCNDYFPDFVDSSGQIARQFFMDAKHYTYTTGGIIPYAELDTLRDSVRICCSNHCSKIFAIPYKDCYKLVIDMVVPNTNIYDGGIRKMCFRKQRNKLTLIKSELSGPIPD